MKHLVIKHNFHFVFNCSRNLLISLSFSRSRSRSFASSTSCWAILFSRRLTTCQSVFEAQDTRLDYPLYLVSGVNEVELEHSTRIGSLKRILCNKLPNKLTLRVGQENDEQIFPENCNSLAVATSSRDC